MLDRSAELADRIGLSFGDPALLANALVHTSYLNEHPDEAGESNERLEFLGDAVLSLVITEELYARHPAEPEGVLTTRRAAIVSTRGLADIGRRLGIGSAIVLGQGAESSGERDRSRVLAGVFEAIIAAVYLDAGLDAARDFILSAAAPQLDAELPADALKAPKSRLQEHAFAMTGQAPTYRIVRTDGPDHDRHFTVEVELDGEVVGSGEGRSHREAETDAASAALAALAENSKGSAGQATP